MTLENFYFVAGIVTGLGVIVSLIFVGIQIREQNRESKLAAIHAASVQYHHMMEVMVNNSTLAGAWAKSLDGGFADLDANERISLSSYIQLMMRTFEDMYFQNKEDRLEDRVWEALEVQLAELMTTDGFQEYWGTRAHYFSEDFRSFVKTIPNTPYTLGRPFDGLRGAEHRAISSADGIKAQSDS